MLGAQLAGLPSGRACPTDDWLGERQAVETRSAFLLALLELARLGGGLGVSAGTVRAGLDTTPGPGCARSPHCDGAGKCSWNNQHARDRTEGARRRFMKRALQRSMHCPCGRATIPARGEARSLSLRAGALLVADAVCGVRPAARCRDTPELDGASLSVGADRISLSASRDPMCGGSTRLPVCTC